MDCGHAVTAGLPSAPPPLRAPRPVRSTIDVHAWSPPTSLPFLDASPHVTKWTRMTNRRLAVVCDDDMAIRMIVSVLLKEEGFEVVTAATAAELADFLSGGLPEVVVLDSHLPDATGEDLVDSIMATSPNCRIILFSGRRTAGNADAVFASVTKQGTQGLAEAIHRAARS